MRILLLGANGQVGWELQRSLAPLGELKACDRSTANLENLDKLKSLINDFKPEIIVNAAAHTAVDEAESEPEKAKSINFDATELLAIETKKLNAWLIHYSTDYVYDGTKSGAYTETDKTNPQSVYGVTKLQGEDAIRKSGCKHLIFRTSWVYATRGANFAKTMLRLASERDELKVVADQFGAPTSAELIADTTALCLCQIVHRKALSETASGTYHLTPTGETSWFDFAKYVLQESEKRGARLRVSPESLQAIPTSEYPLPAKRPKNSRLSTKKLSDTFGIHLPSWQTHVNRLVTEISQQESQ